MHEARFHYGEWCSCKIVGYAYIELNNQDHIRNCVIYGNKIVAGWCESLILCINEFILNSKIRMDIQFISRLDWLFRFSKCINK